MMILSLMVIVCGIVNTSLSTPSPISPSDHQPCHVTRDVMRNGSSVDCSNRHLKTIPEDLPDDTVILNFQGNELVSLKNASFVHLPRLVELNLAECRLREFDFNPFEGLFNLQRLWLHNNELLLDNSTYHKDIFLSLEQLTHLDLRFNDERITGTIPDKIFLHIRNLEWLGLDTFKDEIFGEGFKHLKKLKTLTFSGPNDKFNYCAITRLRNDTFRVFENTSLALLDLSDCRLYRIETGTFLPLSQISVINMNTVRNIPIDTAIRSLYGVNGKNISRLIIPHCFYPKKVQVDFIRKQIIEKKTMDGLSNLCIEYLDISHNRIIYIEKSFVFTISKCLKYLDISHNNIMGDVLSLPLLSVMENLEYIDFSFQTMVHSSSDGTYEWDKAKCGEDNLSENCILSSRKGYEGVEFPLPPFIKVLKMQSITNNFGDLPLSKIYGGKHLIQFDVIDNGMRQLKGHITGLENVERIGFSKNNGSGMTESFLTSFAGVEELSLGYMDFDEHALNPGGDVYLGIRSLTKIKILDLTGNNIRFLSDDFFEPLPGITSLHLSDNGFVSVPTDLTFVPELRLLDLSLNSITYLHDDEIEELEMLGQKNSLDFRLAGNPFSCSCESLAFISWLFNTNVSLDKGGNYSCVTEDGILTSTAAVNEEFNLHWTSCQSRLWLSVAITMMSIFALIIVSTMLVQRNWTRLQHHLMVLLGKGVKRVRREAFQKDAYVAHCESYQDSWFVNGDLKHVLEDRYNLRLILPDRDFRAGQFVADNVVDSVNNSWKTVLVATQEFLEDPWSFFIMKSATYAVSDANPNRVIILLIGNVNRGQVSKDLLNVTEEDDIFQLDVIPDADDYVWESVKDRILKEYP